MPVTLVSMTYYELGILRLSGNRAGGGTGTYADWKDYSDFINHMDGDGNGAGYFGQFLGHFPDGRSDFGIYPEFQIKQIKFFYD